MSSTNLQQHLKNWAGEKAAKTIVYVLLPVYALSMYRNLIQQPDFLIAGYYTLLLGYFVALGWWGGVKPGLRLLGVSLGIMAIALGVLLRNQDLGFALTFAVVASGIMPLAFDRRKAPYLALIPLLLLALIALVGEVTEPMIIAIISGGSMAVVYILTATFCYMLDQTEAQRDAEAQARRELAHNEAELQRMLIDEHVERARMDAFAQVADVAYFEFDFETQTLTGNSVLYARSGLPPDSAPFSVAKVVERLSLEDQAALQQHITNVMALKPGVAYEFVQTERMPDASRIQVRVIGVKAIRDGKAFFAGASINVSEEYGLVEQLKQQAQRLSILADAGKSALTEMDFETGLVRGNAEFYSRLGLPADTESVAIEEYFKGVREPVRSELPALAEHILNGAEGELLTFSHDYDAPDGSVRHYRVSATKAVRNGRTFIDGVSIDVTDEVEAERLIEEQLEVIRSQRERQARMYAVIGHELRTPAASLKMMLDTLEEGEQLDRSLVESNIEQLLTVIDSLRAAAQPKALMEASFDEVQLADVLVTQIDEFKPLAQQQSVALIAETSGLLERPVRLQKSLLRQVVGNLIKNALLHSGGTEVKLIAHSELLSEQQKRLRIEVCDNGKGIPAERVEHLFEAFVRGSTDAEGTGLGLHICREIITSLGGDLRYETRADGGSCFVVELDLALEEGESIPVPSSATDAQSLEGKRVLLAEDNKTLQMLMQKMLEKQGAEVVVADNGQMALDAFHQGDFDLLLSDIFMPQMNGYELVRQVRSRGAKLPVIGLTAATIGEETEQMLAAGADAVLSKPTNTKQLEETFAQIMEQRAARA